MVLTYFEIPRFQSARLAELAIHLGSSDNITVIVIRLFCGTGANGN
jgi:serine/threonine protein phosphatase PrpC